MKNLTVTGLIIAVLFTLFAGCSKIENNAVILDDRASESINPDFYNDNFTRGAHSDGDPDVDDDSYPESRVFLVRTQEEHDRIFSPDALYEIDYSREMIVVYTFTSIYLRSIEIRQAKTESGQLDLVLEMKKPFGGKFNIFVGDACSPFQRYVVIKMDRMELTEATVRLDQ